MVHTHHRIALPHTTTGHRYREGIVDANLRDQSARALLPVGEEPNIRYRNTFYAAAFRVPGLQRFAEDMLVEELATGCRLTWTFAIERKPPLRTPLTLGSTIVTSALRRTVNDTKIYFDQLSANSHH